MTGFEEEEAILKGSELPDELAQLKKTLVNDMVDLVSPEADQEDVPLGQRKLTPRQFLEKYRPLLLRDIDSYSSVIQYIRPMQLDKTYLDQVLDIGKEWLDKPEAGDYIWNTLDSLATGATLVRDGAITLDDPNPENIFNERYTKVLQQATAAYETNPTLLVDALAVTDDHYPDRLSELEAMIRPALISDPHFYELAEFYGNHVNNWTIPKVYKACGRIMMISKEKKFENIAIFKKIAKEIIRSYPSHKNNPLVELVLERGDHFINQDTQTRDDIALWLVDSGYGQKPRP